VFCGGACSILTLERISESNFLSNAPPISEEAFCSGRFPGIAFSPFWKQERVDEDEHGELEE